MNASAGIWKWSERIAPVASEYRVTLGEGGTPLVRSRRIGPEAGLEHLYFKLEHVQPSGSYKDRFAAVAISRLLERKAPCCLATSSGNTGAALATYCAAAGIPCRIAILETTPAGKLVQMLAHGADLFRIRGFGVDPEINRRVFDVLTKVGEAKNAPPQISAFRYSPEGMSGVCTISYELAEQRKHVERPLGHVFVPAGGGGLALAVAKGFESQPDMATPRIEVVQPEGNDTIASALREGASEARSVASRTAISGLQVGSVIDGDAVIAHCRKTGGSGHVVSDEVIWKVQRRLAVEEGIFCEPAGAVALAGALQAASRGEIDSGATVVCLVSGSGFKDSEALERLCEDTNVPTLEASDLKDVL